MWLIAEIHPQFGNAPSLAMPAERFGDGREREIELAPVRPALVAMHASDHGPYDSFPGWRRAVEYLLRAEHNLTAIVPPLLVAVRASPIRVFQVLSHRRDQSPPQARRAARLADARMRRLTANRDSVHQERRRMRAAHAFPGAHNQADIDRSFAQSVFAPSARPVGREDVAADGNRLATFFRIHGINDFVYAGFAVNWSLLVSPGGMVDMARHGYLCSTVHEAVTAVETRETAHQDREKQQVLWRVVVELGVFRLDLFLRALPARFP